MGWRFRKSIKVLPGVKVNLSKKGISSTTIGGKYVRANVSGKGVTPGVSLPGTGLSYQAQPLLSQTFPQEQESVTASKTGLPLWAILLCVFSVGLVLSAVGLLFYVAGNSSSQKSAIETPVKSQTPTPTPGKRVSGHR